MYEKHCAVTIIHVTCKFFSTIIFMFVFKTLENYSVDKIIVKHKTLFHWMNKYDDDNWKENDLRKIDYAIGLTINRK